MFRSADENVFTLSSLFESSGIFMFVSICEKLGNSKYSPTLPSGTISPCVSVIDRSLIGESKRFLVDGRTGSILTLLIGGVLSVIKLTFLDLDEELDDFLSMLISVDAMV
eukprot:NODE_71_length_23666_cov_0.239403.p14 type:complete len:110 gc:universal NODE_71_length_23666_cov_0.239403:13386-13715(+)